MFVAWERDLPRKCARCFIFSDWKRRGGKMTFSRRCVLIENRSVSLLELLCRPVPGFTCLCRVLGSWYLTPSQLRRSYQGETEVIESQIKVWFTVLATCHLLFEEDGGNEVEWSGKANMGRADFLASLALRSLYRGLNFCIRGTPSPPPRKDVQGSELAELYSSAQLSA